MTKRTIFNTPYFHQAKAVKLCYNDDLGVADRRYENQDDTSSISEFFSEHYSIYDKLKRKFPQDMIPKPFNEVLVQLRNTPVSVSVS